MGSAGTVITFVVLFVVVVESVTTVLSSLALLLQALRRMSEARVKVRRIVYAPSE